MWLFILITVIVVSWIYKKITKDKLPMFSECIRFYSGAPGSGKTLNAVKEAVDAYFEQKRIHEKYIKKKNKLTKWIYRMFHKRCIYEATLFANIPIKIGTRKVGKKKENVFCNTLKKEHLLMQEKLPEGCVICIDEIGAFIPQWDYDNPFVKEQIQYFFRYFRHFLDGKCIITEQASSRVAKVIREVLGKFYYLDSFHKLLGFLPIAKINITPMLMAEDNSTVITQEYGQYAKYVWLWGKKRYESRCFKKLYTEPMKRTCEKFTDFYTTYIIDVSASAEDVKTYQKNRDVFREWKYNRRKMKEWKNPVKKEQNKKK